MQQNKLQELTDKLYKEGLSKGQQEAEQLLATAKDEAAQIIENAKAEAAQIIADAQKSAIDQKVAAESEIRLATRQSMAAVKQELENSILTKAIAEPIKNAVNEKEFMQKMIVSAIEKFNPQGTDAGNLSLLLPADKQQELQKFAEEQLHKQLNQGLSIQFDKSFKAGFKIGVSGSGYHISLTDQDFEALFCNFLRAKVSKILYNKD